MDPFHLDISYKVIDKQDKLGSVTKHSRKFAMGGYLYARNFSDTWIPITVTHITGRVSYQVQTPPGTIQQCHVDQLRYRYSLDSNNQDSNDFDDWPFLCTTSTTDTPLP